MKLDKLNVLLIEDDEDDYLIIENVFARIKGITFNIDWVSTFSDAQERMASRDQDVYLVDYRLGDATGTGLDLLRQAREQKCRKPIIILTGQGDLEVDMEAMKAGASDYLVKGDLNARMLERSIRYAVNISQTIDTLREARDELAAEIEERKKVEAELLEAKKAAENASRIKSEFLSNVSHEIRTPMCTIIGMSELLSESSLDKEQQVYVGASMKAGNDLLHLIDEIIEISKIEADQIELEEVPFDFDDVLLKIASIFEKNAQKKGIQLICNISSEVPNKLIGDPEHLGEVLTNLINNAIKFTKQGEVAIEVKMAEGEKQIGSLPHLGEVKKNGNGIDSNKEIEGCYLQFSIEDTGIGIPVQKINTIFDSFSQADSSSTRVYGGVGLGITISKKLVEMMGGNIWVESEEGKGSVFTFTAKLWRHQAEMGAEHSVPNIRFDGNRILLIGDSATYRSIVESELQERGALIASVASGNDGLTKIRCTENAGNRFDLIIIDYIFPEIDGTALIEQIREQGAMGKDIPILLLGAYCNYFDAGKIYGSGVVKCIMKPVRISDLLSAISKAISMDGGCR